MKSPRTKDSLFAYLFAKTMGKQAVIDLLDKLPEDDPRFVEIFLWLKGPRKLRRYFPWLVSAISIVASIALTMLGYSV